MFPEIDNLFVPEPPNPLRAGTVSAVIVSFSDPDATRRAVDSLLSQSSPPIEVLVLDNHPKRLTATAIAGWSQDPRVRLIHSGQNLGYTAACNRAAANAAGDWLFFLNPDARADADCLATLLRAADARTGVLGAQVLLPDGRTNAGDNPLHLTGIGWAGRFGEPLEHGPPRDVAAVSGAALLARASAYRALSGLCERFFMYYDDADLCWRTRLAGWKVVFCPDALAWHEYEFDQGSMKWFWLERNRLWSLLANYSAASLCLLAPLLAGTELMVIVVAVRHGWLGSLLRAWVATLRGLPRLLSWRRKVQASRQNPDSEIISLMSGKFETGLLRSQAASRANPLVECYRRATVGILRIMGR
ncbi:MAG: glycosyltransferase family 2 protein [Solirubrobacterales bacterium]|nr:glycosyltransferase family 2 protein [Solirubrobacterales bacterium]